MFIFARTKATPHPLNSQPHFFSTLRLLFAIICSRTPQVYSLYVFLQKPRVSKIHVLTLSAPTPSNMEAIFEANDLDVLHMILDYLHDGPLSIIRASQVCHRWSRIIDLESPLTQQRLFLVSEPETFDPACVEPTFCGRLRRREYTPDEDGTTPYTPPTPNPDIKIRSTRC